MPNPSSKAGRRAPVSGHPGEQENPGVARWLERGKQRGEGGGRPGERGREEERGRAERSGAGRDETEAAGPGALRAMRLLAVAVAALLARAPGPGKQRRPRCARSRGGTGALLQPRRRGGKAAPAPSRPGLGKGRDPRGRR